MPSLYLYRFRVSCATNFPDFAMRKSQRLPSMAFLKVRRISIKNRKNSSIISLPEDALVEILARVGSSSVADLVNARRSCKDFLQASNHKFVFEKLSMREFQFVPWRVRDRELMDWCRDSGNAEALYRQGMADYFFGGKRADSGLQYLRSAAERGHAEARYVYGMILLLSPWDQEARAKGRDILSLLVGDGSGRHPRIGECRKNVRKGLSNLWVFNKSIIETGGYINDGKVCEFRTEQRGGWRSEEDDDGRDLCRGSCSWQCEAKLFCRIIRSFLVG